MVTGGGTSKTKGRSKLGEERTIEFHYIKSPSFRTVHADGVIGGPTYRGYIHMSVYNERPAIPQVVTAKFDHKGNIKEQETTQGLQGVTRELDVDVILDKEAAKALYTWLGEHLQAIEKREKQLDDQKTGAEDDS